MTHHQSDVTPVAMPHHDSEDIALGPILKMGLGLIVTIAVSCAIVFGIYRVLEAQESRPVTPQYPLAAQTERRLPPEPRLQTHPRQDLQDLRNTEEAQLSTYGWIDRRAELVHVPVDVAMKMLVDRGLPVRQDAAK